MRRVHGVIGAVVVFCSGCFQPTTEIDLSGTLSPRPPETTQPPGVGAPSSRGCGFERPADPSRGVIAYAEGRQLWMIRADRSQKVVHTFGTQREGADPITVEQIVTGKGRVAAAARIHGKSQSSVEVVLLDEQGQRLWSETKAGEYSAGLFLNDQGILGVAYYQGGGVVVLPDRVLQFDDLSPVAEASADGFVPLRRRVGDRVELAWLDGATGSLLPFSRAVDDMNASFVWSGGWLVYFAPSNGSPVLVMERPGEVEKIPFPIEPEGSHTWVADVSSSGWLLLTRWTREATHVWVVRAGSSTMDAIAFRAPGNPSPDGLQIDEDGSLLLARHDGVEQTVLRSRDLGQSWEPVVGWGAELYGNVSAIRKGGTLLLTETYAVYAIAFRPAAVVHESSSVERSLEGVGWSGALPSMAAEDLLSDDGQCVLLFEQQVRDGPMRVVAAEVEGDRQWELLEVTGWLPSLTWIP